MTIKALFPSTRPILNLDFAKAKALDPRVTFTRASTATFVGADGLIKTAASGAARFDHNPATGESLGLLVEEARTNQALYSGDFSNAAWVVAETTKTANALVALDGTTTAALVKPTAINAQHRIKQDVTTADSLLTFSIYLKAAGYSRIALNEQAQTGSFSSTINLADGSGASAGTVVSNAGNGWYRVSWSSAFGTGNPKRFCVVVLPNGGSGENPNNFNWTADGTSGIYVWGAQLEAGSFPTSYIPTTTATVTRAADVATVSNTGSSIFPISAFTAINFPYGTTGGSTNLSLIGPRIKQTLIYNGNVSQTQINAVASINDNFWQWRIIGSSFALPSFTTNGTVTVDWGDGTVETLTTGIHTFTNGSGYHDIKFRLNSGTYFKPYIGNNATHKDKVIAVGPVPFNMKVNSQQTFYGCSNLKCMDGYADYSDQTYFGYTWGQCTSLLSFPFINTSYGTDFTRAWWNTAITSFPLINTSNAVTFSGSWANCYSLTSFPLIDTSAATIFSQTWYQCFSLASFPTINTAAGVDFASSWLGCAFSSFPLLNFVSATNFNQAWRACSSLSSFPANAFNTTGTLISAAFGDAFLGCALTAASIENILTSLVTNGQSNITLGLNSGTNAGATTWTTAANTAYATLISRGWTITRNA